MRYPSRSHKRFEAVTHALHTTSLTDKQGRRLGNALDLVETLETAHGKIPRARGDLQFRIYVVLRPTHSSLSTPVANSSEGGITQSSITRIL